MDTKMDTTTNTLNLDPGQQAIVDAAAEFAENLSNVIRDAAVAKVDRNFLIDTLSDYIGVLLKAQPASSSEYKSRLNSVRNRIQKPHLSVV